MSPTAAFAGLALPVIAARSVVRTSPSGQTSMWVWLLSASCGFPQSSGTRSKRTGSAMPLSVADPASTNPRDSPVEVVYIRPRRPAVPRLRRGSRSGPRGSPCVQRRRHRGPPSTRLRCQRARAADPPSRWRPSVRGPSRWRRPSRGTGASRRHRAASRLGRGGRERPMPPGSAASSLTVPRVHRPPKPSSPCTREVDERDRRLLATSLATPGLDQRLLDIGHDPPEDFVLLVAAPEARPSAPRGPGRDGAPAASPRLETFPWRPGTREVPQARRTGPASRPGSGRPRHQRCAQREDRPLADRRPGSTARGSR